MSRCVCRSALAVFGALFIVLAASPQALASGSSTDFTLRLADGSGADAFTSDSYAMRNCYDVGSFCTAYLTITRGGTVIAQSPTVSDPANAAPSTTAPGGLQLGDVVSLYVNTPTQDDENSPYTLVAQATDTGQPTVDPFDCNSSGLSGDAGPPIPRSLSSAADKAAPL